MQLTPVRPTVKAPAEAFTGDVYFTPIHRGEGLSRMIVILVRFTPGAHTNWHSHAVGQTLHVTDGIGLVATRDGTVICMRPGDTVHTPPGEEHWHGATADTFIRRFALLEASRLAHWQAGGLHAGPITAIEEWGPRPGWRASNGPVARPHDHSIREFF